MIQAGNKVLANPADETRCLSLTLEVSEEQTRRILDKQAQMAMTVRPNLSEELEVWQEAQRRLVPCHVTVPFADRLKESFPTSTRRSHRDFPRLLWIIGAHACLHQRQRTCYEQDGQMVVVAELQDYAAVYKIAASFISQASKGMTKAQQEVFEKVKTSSGGNAFTVQNAANWCEKRPNTVRDHLKALEKLGMLEPHKLLGPADAWRVISDVPRGVTLPSPDEVAALLTRKFRNLATNGYTQAETLTGADSVTTRNFRNLDGEVNEAAWYGTEGNAEDTWEEEL